MLFARIGAGQGELPQLSVADRRAQVAHEGLVVVQVVDGIESCPEDFVHPLQMVQVGPGEVRAGVARAGRVGRAQVGAVAAVAQLDDALAGEQPAVAVLIQN